MKMIRFRVFEVVFLVDRTGILKKQNTLLYRVEHSTELYNVVFNIATVKLVTEDTV